MINKIYVEEYENVPVGFVGIAETPYYLFYFFDADRKAVAQIILQDQPGSYMKKDLIFYYGRRGNESVSCGRKRFLDTCKQLDNISIEMIFPFIYGGNYG